MKLQKNSIKIKVFGWDDLNKNKQKQIKSFFKKGQKRLFGYASWKPEIILSYLNEIPENSILQYSDIGCFFNSKGIKRLNDYTKIAEENKVDEILNDDINQLMKDAVKVTQENPVQGMKWENVILVILQAIL